MILEQIRKPRHGNTIASSYGGVCTGDNSEQEKEVAKVEHHGNTGCLIAATSNKVSGEPGGRARDGAEAAQPDRCLQV
jgi:hypothetical protein